MARFAIFVVAAAACAAFAGAQQASPSIQVPPGARVVLEAKGDGVQIYTCAGAAGALKWMLKGPDARLLDRNGKDIGTHFAGPTWKLADGSQVQGELIASRPSPDAGSVPWLLLRAKAGSGAGRLAGVHFIRRTETRGGVAPAAGCQDSGDLDKTVRVPYSATYSFYTSGSQ